MILIKEELPKIPAFYLRLPVNTFWDHFQTTYVSLQLRVQNRRRKWHFPLNFQNDIIWTSPFPPNICNAINWAGVTSKAFSSSEALMSVLSKNARLYDNTVHCTYIQMVTSGYQFMNLKFVHLSKNMPTEHQNLVTVLAYRKYCRRRFKYPPWTSQGNNICIMELFVTILKRVVKLVKNNLLQHVPAFWSYSFWNGKRKQAPI